MTEQTEMSAAVAGMPPLTGLKFVQIAYATTDVRASARRWHEMTGAGPFFIREHVPTSWVRSFGEEGVFDHTCALGQWGKVMVEFVHHHELAPARLDEAMRRGSTGIHHVAAFVDDLDEARDQLLRHGATELIEASTPETRFMFFYPGPEFGHLIELYEETDYLSGLYQQIEEASHDWDGSDLFRERG